MLDVEEEFGGGPSGYWYWHSLKGRWRGSEAE